MGWRWAADGMERCIQKPRNSLRCSKEFLHSAQQKQTFKFQATEQDLVILRFRSKNSLQLTWSTIAVGTSSDEGNFCLCTTKGNTGFETEDFATRILHLLCCMYKPKMKADKGRPSRAGHSEIPCISLREFSNQPLQPAPRALPRPCSCDPRPPESSHGVAELPVHTWTQTQIQCWICCQ